MSSSKHSYYLRSRSDNKIPTITSNSPITPIEISESPDTPQYESSSNLDNKSNAPTPNPSNKRRTRRKRKFTEFTLNDNNNQHHDNLISNQDININQDLNLPQPPNKKFKRISKRIAARNKLKTKISPNTVNKTIKFTLNERPILSKSISFPSNSKILSVKPRKPKLSHFEIPLFSKISSLRRNPFICCYTFLGGYLIGIKPVLGSRNEIREGIKILSQDLKSTRCKASISTTKDTFIIYIKNVDDDMIGFGVLHIDHIWKRVNIEMFAVDYKWRGNGFASMMIYLIQYKMNEYIDYDLFVCAANDALPFWLNKKYQFVLAHKNILEQHELLDEKYGKTTHLIWHGHVAKSKQKLLKSFIQTS